MIINNKTYKIKLYYIYKSTPNAPYYYPGILIPGYPTGIETGTRVPGYPFPAVCSTTAVDVQKNTVTS